MCHSCYFSSIIISTFVFDLTIQTNSAIFKGLFTFFNKRNEIGNTGRWAGMIGWLLTMAGSDNLGGCGIFAVCSSSRQYTQASTSLPIHTHIRLSILACMYMGQTLIFVMRAA